MDWQARASELVNIIDPTRRFKAGEFEALDDTAWRALVTELRGKALTDEKLAEIRLAEQQKKAERAAILAKLTKQEREKVGL